MNLISQITGLWDDPRLIYAVAIAAVVLLAITIWLFRRAKRDGRAAGTICLVLSVALHAVLIYLVPYQVQDDGGSSAQEVDPIANGVESLTFSTFDPDLAVDDASGDMDTPSIEPLPIAELQDLLAEPFDEPVADDSLEDIEPQEQPPTPNQPPPTPESLATASPSEISPALEQIAQDLDASLDQLLQSQLELAESAAAAEIPEETAMVAAATPEQTQHVPDAMPPQDAAPPIAQATESIEHAETRPPVATTRSAAAVVPGSEQADFANRVGAAKQLAIAQTGGDARTEAAVKAALRFLAAAQRPDGAWDPQASGAGEDRMPLGERRPGAGSKSATGLTGLSLLAMMGAGNTHLSGDYAENVYRGLAYLIRTQHPDGSLSGNATVYAASYCHSMAALSLCEAAVMTNDKSAIESSRRAIAHTVRMQHPVTGGWRYTRGDPGDLSQLGWQAMVLDGGKRAGITIERDTVAGVARFLRSVRAGRGGLACYRPGEAISRTMTAEALATRLLIGEDVPQAEIDEAERYLLESLPGTRQDNYYYWYYATLALHQLQDEAWERWNAALKDRLLATQRADGSWPADTVWGGYGGTVYTTAMATLCLESYYRHAIRNSNARIATGP
ncbi:squalene--hopene cyclase [Stieleria magnilauensis]|uniref:Pectic acid lyase n=1 Tax=Stieleria magnilauensis TaxID=2527963 RepID=A0ABX5XNI3_9BACT|nr:Pectic acid lyase [Planctomycetes bacterium TBK1r]